MNPYDFVRIDWKQSPRRLPPAAHNKFDGLAGMIHGTITAETPVFIPDKRFGGEPKRFIRNQGGKGDPIIPGSSLKGMIRNLVETIGPGCWCLFDGRYGKGPDAVDYTKNLPNFFSRQQCGNANALCVACRLFGMLSGGTVLLGKIEFADAICKNPLPHKAVYTPILDAPKPRHSAWYVPNGTVAGRKFYYHQRLRTLGALKKTAAGAQLNQYIEPLDSGTEFDFNVSFKNVGPDEWPLLLYALALEDEMRHKIGYAKPAGFGSIRINITAIRLLDLKRRYVENDNMTNIYEGSDLTAYLQVQTMSFRENHASVTLNDLRRIWKWPIAEEANYDYPTRDWFTQNPRTPISETP